MIAIRSKIIFLVACVVEALFILAMQILGSTPLLLVCLAIFLALIAWSAIKGMAVPVILFFLPFAPLIKLRPGTISFFTIGLLVVYVIYIFMGSRNINIYHWIPGLCLIAIALVVKTLYGYSIDNGFILFSASILLIPFLTRELDVEYDFYWLTVFFALGIIIAAITAKYLAIFPTITRYIGTNVGFGIIRRSGYYGDPNFYSAHITAALSGALVLLLNNIKGKRTSVLIILSGLLVYCGFLSVSKSFMLIAICLFFAWLVEFMFMKGRLSAKLMIFFTFLVGAVFLLSTTVFTDLAGMMLSRFSGVNNLSDFTTGRIELWSKYLNAFAEDPLLLFFGKGFTSVLIFEKATHNTIIQAIYQFGIIGCAFLTGWIVCSIRILLNETKIYLSDMAQIFILLLGIFGPWMALDLLFFDEFFLMIVYVCVALKFIDKRKYHISARIE